MREKFIGIFICMLVSTTSCVIIGQGVPSHKSYSTIDQIPEYIPNALIRIEDPNTNIVLPKGVEIAGARPGEWLDLILPQNRLSELSDLGIDYSVQIQDIDAYSDDYRGQYHTFAQIQQILQTTAATYPEITQLFSIGTTYEGRPIWCLEISDNPGVSEDEPGVFFIAEHHAREWPTVEITLNIITKLTSQYGINATLTDMVNNRRIWVVPTQNPDGYYYSHDQGHDWRKNRHYFPQYGTTGVDTNRNYDGAVDGNAWGAWGSVGSASVSHYPSSETYCGPGSFSELENQAVRDFVLANDITASISWHTYGELLMWPWGYSSSQHAPDNTYLIQLGQAMASRITRESGSGTYTPQQSAGLYPTTGDTSDWIYGYGCYVLGKPMFSFTIEACAEFQAPVNKLDQICAENFDAALYLLQQAQTIRTTVVPRVLPPLVDDIHLEPNRNYTVSWVQQNPAANPDYYQLDELSGLSLQTDTAETGTSLWTLDGFSLSTQRYHSTSHSYKSRNINSDVSTMKTVHPLPVTAGMSLSFWTWYNLENNYDYAFVEVSTDGRRYNILDQFTGSSGWMQKTYDLSAYAGSSLYIRFRATTDQGTLNEGFYVDDITTVPFFQTITTLSNTITQPFYQLINHPEGDFYYRVRGHNTVHGWCDFSILEKIQVVQYILGDVSYDGVVNFGDINPFVAALQGEAYFYQQYPNGYWPAADCNQDGVVDFGDINPFVAILTGV